MPMPFNTATTKANANAEDNTVALPVHRYTQAKNLNNFIYSSLPYLITCWQNSQTTDPD